MPIKLQPLSQRDPRWAGQTLGTKGTIGDFGCTITCLAILAGMTPDEVNARMKIVGGYAQGNLVIWAKVDDALPNLEYIERGWTYNNDVVKANTPCLVEVDGAPIGGYRHWVVYIGGGRLLDPWTGTEKPTSSYPTPTGYAIYRRRGEVSDVASKKTMTIEQDTFAELVNKSTLYDKFFDAGFSSVNVVTRRLGELMRDLVTEREKIKEQEEIISQLRADLKAVGSPKEEVPQNIEAPIVPSHGSTSTQEGEVDWGFHEDYSYAKKLAWRFVRTGVAAGIAAAVVVAPSVQLDPSNPVPYATAIGSAFVAAFINTAGKAIRDSLNDGDKGAAIEKLPI